MKALTKLGIPIVIAMLIMAIYNVVDTFWVARLGTLPVAAVSVVFPISLLFLGIGLMFGVGGGVYISCLLGAKQVVKASQVSSVSVITSVMLAALIALVCNVFLPDILLFMGANEEMMSLAESYGRLFIISCVIGTLNVSMSNIIVSQGASKTSASAMIIGSIVNVALDPLFIYTFNWGVEGAAWATILSRIVTTAIYIRFLTKAEVKVSLALFAPTIRIYADIIKIGISMFFLQLLQTLSISLLQKAAVKYGAEAVAAVGIVLKIVTLGTNVVFGFVKGLQPMAGYNYGAGNFQRLREAVCCSLILTTSFCVLWSILIVIFTSPIISCFGKDETMQEIARIALRANTIMFFTFGFQFVYSTLYMAAPIVLGIERSTLCPAYCRRLCNLDDAAFCRPNSQGDRSSITSHDRKYIMLNLKDMIMLRLTQTEDFKTIISSCSTEEQVQKASDNFILKVVALCDTEEDTVSLFRILRYTRCRLQAMQKAYPLNGEGEKCVRTTQCH